LEGFGVFLPSFRIQESHAPRPAVLEGSAVYRHVSTLLSRGDKTVFFFFPASAAKRVGEGGGGGKRRLVLLNKKKNKKENLKKG